MSAVGEDRLFESEKVIRRIASKKATIGIYGLGYVGLPLGLTFAASGNTVLGFDIDPDKVECINRSESYFRHIDSASVAGVVRGGYLSATTDFSRTSDCDALIVCVPTPLTQNREPDLSFVLKTARQIARHLRKGQLLCLESTTYPGTTEEELLPIIEKTGLSVGSDVFLSYSPEREDPGNTTYSTDQIPKLVAGHTEVCGTVAVALYAAAFDKVVPVRSCAVAEAAKLLENIYRSVNIALVNELKVMLAKMDIDVWEVIDAAKTKPFGFTPFYPGPGLGGHCIPIDPFYLTWKARQFGLHTRFVELAGEVNTAMPDYVISRVAEALNDVGKPINGSKILVLGAAYKRDVDDVRESPSIELMESLIARGASVSYNDPYVRAIPSMRRHNLELESQELTEESLSLADCVLIATDHSSYDYAWVGRHSSLIVDTRNAMSGVELEATVVWKA